MASKNNQGNLIHLQLTFVFFQIARHFQFDRRNSTDIEKYTQGRLHYITQPCVKTNKKL